MSEPISLMVNRREGRLWVAIYLRGESLADLFPAERSVESLTRALVQADERARREVALPVPERYRNGREYWRAAGCKTWGRFARGLTSCDITRSEDGTVVEYWVPNPKYPDNLAPTDFIENHPADISCEELARVVLRVFESFPPDRKVPIRSR